jgi:uncharacterized protein YajQ (UPF0234 family)
MKVQNQLRLRFKETLRVTSKSRDDLQDTMALVKGQKLDFAVQFTNYR